MTSPNLTSQHIQTSPNPNQTSQHIQTTHPDISESESDQPTHPDIYESESDQPTHPDISESESDQPTHADISESESDQPTHPDITKSESDQLKHPDISESDQPTHPDSHDELSSTDGAPLHMKTSLCQTLCTLLCDEKTYLISFDKLRYHRKQLQKQRKSLPKASRCTLHELSEILKEKLITLYKKVQEKRNQSYAHKLNTIRKVLQHEWNSMF